jgi:excisionase family DNA binding protein
VRQRKAARVRIDITLPIERQPFYLTVADVAAIFGKSTRTIAMWEQKGLLRVSRPAGGTPLISRSEVERLLTEGAV